jgi:predicted DNA-binding transcriptional regulator YafY
MPANKNAIIRYRIIDRCLRNSMRRYPTKEYIRQQISQELFGEGGTEISVSSVEKDLIAMRDDAALGYHAPIRYHKTEKGYYYEDPNYSIDGLGLSTQDSDALREAASLLNAFVELPVFADLKEAIGKINTRFSLSSELDDPGIDQYVQFEAATSSAGKEWLKPVYQYIVQRQPIRFRYNNIYKNEQREHQLDPYLLKEVRNKWYLVGWHNKHQRFTTYALDRISELQPTGKPFTFRRDFDVAGFYKYSTGIMEGSTPPEKLVLEAYGSIARLLRINPLHHSQRPVKELKDGIRMELDVSITEELIRQLLTYSNQLKVIKPVALKKQMHLALQQALALYQPEK